MTEFPFPILDEVGQEIYDVFPINLTRMMLHTPDLVLPYLKFAWSFRKASIAPALRERIIMRVGAVTSCEYELLQHEPEALRTGTSPELLAKLVDPDRHDFGEPVLSALIDYVDSVVTDVGATAAALDAVRTHFSDREVVEITLLAGTYLLCATFVKSLRVLLDEGAADWAAADSKIGAVRL